MFEKFLSKFKPDNPKNVCANEPKFNSGDKYLDEFVKAYANESFNSGIFTVHNPEDICYWNEILTNTFPRYKNKIECFSHDWLGRQFAYYEEKGIVLLFEPGTGDVLEIPVNIKDFLNQELVQYTDAALAESFFQEWLSTSDSVVESSDNCIGYKKPLFLGGCDEISNLEQIDLKVYWGLMSQLIIKTKNLPEGVSIQNITIK
jgi:hypothetical protein